MPVQFNFTDMPSTVVGVDLENSQFFHAYTRTRTLFNQLDMEIATAIVKDVVAADLEAQSIPHRFGPRHYIKLRTLFLDDKNGSVTLSVDYIHDADEKPVFTEGEIKDLLGDGMARHFGQWQSVEVSIKTGMFSSDYFSPVSDQYYKQKT